MDFEIKKSYESLQDEVSRNIFENRLLYSLTENYDFTGEILEGTLFDTYSKHNKFIDNVILANYPQYASAKDEVNSFLLSQNKKVIVYGLSALCTSFVQMCDQVNIAAFCDKNTQKQTSTYLGREVISPEELKNNYQDSFVVVTVLKDINNADILNGLLDSGFSRNQILILKDYLVSHGMSNLFSSYFERGIISIQPGDVFVDAGCYDGQDTIQFMMHCNNEHAKTLAFEPNPLLYTNCVQNLKNARATTVYPYGLWSETAELALGNLGPNSRVLQDPNENVFKIKTVKLDDILNGENVSYIKMDIEAAELNALKGAEQTVLKHRPRLAISVYHKPEDIWELPNYILSLQSDYKLYLRHYSLYQSETVLYAV